jgi:hypothetical protein
MTTKSSAILLGLTLALAFTTACNSAPTEHSQFIEVGMTRFGTKIANMELYTGRTAHLTIKQVENKLSYLDSGKCRQEHELDNPAHQGWCAAEKVPFQQALDKLRP